MTVTVAMGFLFYISGTKYMVVFLSMGGISMCVFVFLRFDHCFFLFFYHSHANVCMSCCVAYSMGGFKLIFHENCA